MGRSSTIETTRMTTASSTISRCWQRSNIDVLVLSNSPAVRLKSHSPLPLACVRITAPTPLLDIVGNDWGMSGSFSCCNAVSSTYWTFSITSRSWLQRDVELQKLDYDLHQNRRPERQSLTVTSVQALCSDSHTKECSSHYVTIVPQPKPFPFRGT